MKEEKKKQLKQFKARKSIKDVPREFFGTTRIPGVDYDFMNFTEPK